MENKLSEREILVKLINNQLWYDRVRLTSPVEVDKVVNDYSERFALDGSLIEVQKILRYTDLVRIAGSETVQDLKRFFGSFNDVDFSELSVEDLRKLAFIIESFPYSANVSTEGFNISALIEREIELLHTDSIVRG